MVTADDGNGGSVTDTFTWNVTNPGPVAGNDSFTTNEDTSFSGTVATNDNDPDGDTVTFAQNTGPSNGSLSFASDGSFTFLPDADFFGTDSFTYTITDADGATDTATVTITINPVNDAPTVSPIADQTDQDSDVISLDVSGNFSDTENDTLTFSATGLPTGLSIDANTGVISGTIDGSASQSGPFTVMVTADDGNGGSVTDTFTWNVTNPGPSAGNDSFSTSEDTPISGSVATNDNDPDGDSLTFVQTSSPAHGTVVLNSDGMFTYTPNADFNGTDSFDYNVIDFDGALSTATVTISVGAVNDPPLVATPVSDQSDLDSATVNLDVSGNFGDVEGDSLVFSATGLPIGLSIDSNTGTISGMLDSSASVGSPYTVMVTASDGNGGTVTDTFTWTVTNPGPVASNDSFTTNEDTAISGSVATNDNDADGDSLSFAQTSSPTNGALVFNSDGSFSYTPDPDFSGTDSFAYQVTDADGAVATATVNIAIHPVNDAPTVTSPVADQNNFDSDTVSLDVSTAFMDTENDTLTFSATGLPTGLSIDPNTGVVSGTIGSSASQTGPFTVSITADDGNGGLVSDTFSWNVTNPPPNVGNDSFSTMEDVALNDSVAGNDGDPDGDSLTFNQTSNPTNGSVVFNNDGTFTYTPSLNFVGIDSFDYEVVDADGAAASATVTINVGGVNDLPIVDAPIADQTSLDSDIVSFDVSPNFSDPENDPLTFTATGLPTGLVIDPNTGVISGTIDPSASQVGPFTVFVTVDDGNGGMATDTFLWTVSNPAPAATDNTASVTEDIQNIGSGNVLLDDDGFGVDSDPDGDALSVGAVEGDPGNVGVTVSGSFGTVQINATGDYTYTLDTLNPTVQGLDGGETLTESFTYSIDDGQGGTATATLQVTINGTNDAPVATAIVNQSDQDSDLITFDVSSAFSDVEGDTLTFSATGLPGGLSIDPNTGIISGTIDNNASQGGPASDGIYTVSVTATDDDGEFATSAFAWTVTNPVPIANDDNFITTEDTVFSGTVTFNDSDADGDALSYSVVTGPSNGVLTMNSDGSFSYAPDPNFFGTDSFDYEVCDADGACANATVIISVNPVDDVPVVDTPIADQSSNDSDLISLNVGPNFSDVEGPLTFSATDLPPGLSMDTSGNITGTIDSSASTAGPYTVVVSAEDSGGNIVTDTFAWSVTNPAPFAGDDSFSTPEDTLLTGSVAANDLDPDGDTMTYNPVVLPANGTLILNSDGTFNYNPDAGFNGTDLFVYEATDADGATASASVTISIGAVNDPPVVVAPIADPTSLDSDTINFDVSTSFNDPDGDTLTYSAIGLPPGLTIDAVTGTISGTIASSASQGGPYTVVVTATDPNGLNATDTFSWTVDNPAPVATDDSFTISEDSPLIATVATNDSDSDGDVLSYNVTSGPGSGIVSMNPDGSFTYTPDSNFFGTDTFEYEVCDADGLCATASVTVTVDPVNDAPFNVGQLPDLTNDDGEAVLANAAPFFGDVEGGPLTFTATGLPPGIIIDSNTGDLSGTIDPSASVGGPYNVVVTVEDPEGAVSSQTFIWTVINTDPVATINQTAVTENGGPGIGNLITGNGGIGADTDADGDTLRIGSINGTTVSGPTSIIGTHGILTVNPDGSYSYSTSSSTETLAAGETVFENFTYTVSDDEGGSATSQLIVTITGTNDAPISVNIIPPQTSTEETTITPIDAANFFQDIDVRDVLTYDAGNTLPPGLNIDPVTGIISGTPDPGSEGTYSVTITATDPAGATATQTLVWEVELLETFAFDSFTNQAPEFGLLNDNDNIFGRREILLSKQIEPKLAPEPILAGYAKSGTVLIGRIYGPDGTVLGEVSDTANAAGNWVLNFAGLKHNPGNTRVVIEHVATEEVAVGTSQFELGEDTYRSLQLGATHVEALTPGSILSGTASSTLDDLSRQNANPLNLL